MENTWEIRSPAQKKQVNWANEMFASKRNINTVKITEQQADISSSSTEQDFAREKKWR